MIAGYVRMPIASHRRTFPARGPSSTTTSPSPSSSPKEATSSSSLLEGIVRDYYFESFRRRIDGSDDVDDERSRAPV